MLVTTYPWNVSPSRCRGDHLSQTVHRPISFTKGVGIRSLEGRRSPLIGIAWLQIAKTKGLPVKNANQKESESNLGNQTREIHHTHITWRDVTWHDMTWYGMIWYDMIWYDMICDMTWHGMVCVSINIHIYVAHRTTHTYICVYIYIYIYVYTVTTF